MTADDIGRFEKHLSSNSRIPPNHQPSYIRWIESYLQFRATRETTGHAKIREEFRNELARGYQTWQVNQADDAVCMFIRFVGEADEEDQSQPLRDWQTLLDESVRQLRIRTAGLARYSEARV